MRHAFLAVILAGAALAIAGAAQATLIQEDFEGYPTGPGVPPAWFDGSKAPTATWEIVDMGGSRVLRGASGVCPPQADASCGPDNGTGWFVENFEMEVAFCIESGQGGGIGIGQFDGTTYAGNAYFIGVSAPESFIALQEEGLSMGSPVMDIVYLPPGTINHGQWYDLRMVSTGTTFQVWFRPRSSEPWQIGEKVIEVPQDLLHPGHKSYVEGLAGCWVSDGDSGPYGPSTMVFDDFRLEAMPFPAAMDFSDDFEDATFSLANWSQQWCVLDFPALGGSQVGRVSPTTITQVGAISLHQGQQYYTHNFVLRVSAYLNGYYDVPGSWSGGIAWGWEPTATTNTSYHLEMGRLPGFVGFDFNEELNDPDGSLHTLLASYREPEEPGVYWYTVEVRADYNNYYVWWWKRGDPKPAAPVIAIPQDLAHPGYRLMNVGAVPLWQNEHGIGHFDDFFFHGTEAPSVNTPEGSAVEVEPEPGLSMTFDTVSEGGTTTVETSTTAPGGGPGGLEFLGTYYDINTTCVYSGPVTISLTYDDPDPYEETWDMNLRLMHWKTADQVWQDITVLPVDAANNIITGVTDTLSVFAIAALPVFDGFLPPINMPPDAMSVFKQKSTIPVKFRLLDPATGAPVPDALAIIWGERVALGVPSGVTETFDSTQPDGGNTFRYDPDDGQYIFNLSTKGLNPGAVYRIHADIMEGLMDYWVDVALK